jgi:hypothetical protein
MLENYSKYEHVMFSAAFLLVFAAFLRVGEITVKSNRDVNNVLSSKDIIIDQSTSTIFVNIPFFKNGSKRCNINISCKAD